MANAKTFCFKTNQRVEVEEECLKSKMAEKYELNITMTVCQIEKLRRYISCWFPMFPMHLKSQNPLAFYHYLQLQPELNQVMVMIKLKREVI
jgi:hypothetical protein